MPAPETTGLYQWAILWPFTGRFDGDGQPIVGNPDIIPCRWKFKRQESISADGTPMSIDATAVVDQKIDINGRMWLAPQVDDADEVWDEWLGHGVGSGSGGPATEVMYVKTYTETPDLRNRNFTRKVGLGRFRDQA